MKRKLKKSLTKRPCGWLNASSFDYFLTFSIWSKDDDTHQELDEKTHDGMDIGKALKRIMARYRPKFDSLLDYDEPDEVEAENEDEETEEDMFLTVAQRL